VTKGKDSITVMAKTKEGNLLGKKKVEKKKRRDKHKKTSNEQKKRSLLQAFQERVPKEKKEKQSSAANMKGKKGKWFVRQKGGRTERGAPLRKNQKRVKRESGKKREKPARKGGKRFGSLRGNKKSVGGRGETGHKREQKPILVRENQQNKQKKKKSIAI